MTDQMKIKIYISILIHTVENTFYETPLLFGQAIIC